MKLNHHWSVFKAAFGHFVEDQGFILAGNMAFLGMLSLIPFIIFTVALSGFLGQTQAGEEVINIILSNLPPDAQVAIMGPISSIIENTRGDIMTFSILAAVWTAGSGIEAARTAVVQAHGRYRNKKIWMRYLQNFAIVIGAASLAIMGMMGLILGPALVKAANAWLPFADEISKIFNLIRYFLSPLGLFLALYGLHMVLNPYARRHTYRLPGTLLGLVFWIGTAVGFSTYLKYMNTYDVTYGSLAGIVITQIFLFIVSMGFILGAELNAAYARVKAGLRPNDDFPESFEIDYKEKQA